MKTQEIMKKQSKRVFWIDIVKYICIMWVMLSHLESNTDLLETFYRPFFLNGFFFASGYVYYHKDEFNHFFVKKIKGLFVPWLFFSVFNIILSQIISFNEHAPFLEELKWNFLQIRAKGDGIWFVAALFIAFVPFYFFINKYENSQKRHIDKAIFVIVALVLSLLSSSYEKYMNPALLPWGTSHLPWHIEYIFIAMFWMFLGYLFRNEYETIYDSKVKAVNAFMIFLIYISMRYLPFIMKSELKNIKGSILYSYVSAFLGVFILIYVSKKIKVNKYLLYIGQNTLICFALHGKAFTIIQAILKKFTEPLYITVLTNTITSSIFAIIFTLILSFMLIVPIYIINRWFPFLIGRKYRKKEKA